MRGKKALKNIITSLFLEVIKIVCGFIAPIMIIGTFGSAVNGLISSITQFLSYITLLESGIGPVIKAALYKPISQKNNKEIANILKAGERFFRTIALIFIVYICILCVFYPLIINTEFDAFFSISLILIIAIATFAEYFFGITYKLFIQADQKKYVVSNIEIITTVTNTIFIVLLIKMGSSIQVVKLFSAIAFLLRPLLQNLYFRKKYNINLKEADKEYNLKNKWDGLSQHIAAVVHNNTDIAVLTVLSTMEEVSVYSVYLLVVNGIKRFVEALNSGIDATFGDMIVRDENENLNKRFSMYETIYLTIITILFICTLILIVPFISVYTRDVTDANYIRPLFGFLIVSAEFVHSIRFPYHSLVLAAGHFKQTRRGAWVEAISNLGISIILVIKFGIVGVAIGTLVAMIIRTVEFLIYSSRVILKRSLFIAIKKISCVVLEVLIMLVINQMIYKNFTSLSSYFAWAEYAAIILVITSLVVIFANFVMFRKDFKQIKEVFKNMKSKQEE